MPVAEFHLLHGIVLTQIVKYSQNNGSKQDTISLCEKKADATRGEYILSTDKTKSEVLVYVKTSISSKSKTDFIWNFNFNEEELKSIETLFSKYTNMVFVLVCGMRSIKSSNLMELCFFNRLHFISLLDDRARITAGLRISVIAEPNASLRVFSNRENKKRNPISRNAFETWLKKGES